MAAPVVISFMFEAGMTISSALMSTSTAPSPFLADMLMTASLRAGSETMPSVAFWRFSVGDDVWADADIPENETAAAASIKRSILFMMFCLTPAKLIYFHVIGLRKYAYICMI